MVGLIKALGVSVLMLALFMTGAQAQSTTTPQLLIYEGELLSDLSEPLVGDFVFRFSFWGTVDFEATDVVSGAINAAAVDFYGWEEVQSQELNPGGRFSFQVGSVTPFIGGMFDQDALYLQVEVKEQGEPDTAYEVIDVDATDTGVDRKIIVSVPFAFNANQLDYRELGVSPGDIPYIDETTGVLFGAIIPDGADGNVFTIDDDGTANPTDTLSLVFGDSIAESLAWNGLTGQFEFSDDVQISGDLTVTGTINGAVVGPRNTSEVLSPRYPNSIFEEDGTNNSGSMYEEIEPVAGGIEKHILRWETDVAGSQQDYDILVRYTLPSDFSGWQAPAISLDFIAPGGVGDAHVDLRAYKEGDATDQLSGTGLDLSSNVWLNNSFTLSGATTWAAGDTLQLSLKMHSRNTSESRVGDIDLSYITQ